jgi:hypothetical protein
VKASAKSIQCPIDVAELISKAGPEILAPGIKRVFEPAAEQIDSRDILFPEVLAGVLNQYATHMYVHSAGIEGQKFQTSGSFSITPTVHNSQRNAGYVCRDQHPPGIAGGVSEDEIRKEFLVHQRFT